MDAPHQRRARRDRGAARGRAPLAREAQDASILALVNALARDLDGPLRAQVVAELRDALERPQENRNVLSVVRGALREESSRAGEDSTGIPWWGVRDLARMGDASRSKLADDPRDKVAGNARDQLRHAVFRDEVAAELQVLLDSIERHHPVIDADRVRSIGHLLWLFHLSSLDSIVVDWMRRQPSNARVHIASIVLHTLWTALMKIAPASVELLLEARQGELTPEAQDESILALAELTEAARAGFSGLSEPLRARVVAELRAALQRPQNPTVSKVLQRVLEGVDSGEFMIWESASERRTAGAVVGTSFGDRGARRGRRALPHPARAIGVGGPGCARDPLVEHGCSTAAARRHDP
jgi:hypothetical protein